MSPERWQQVKDLFAAALERGEERDDWLGRVCGEDAALRNEVQSLLSANDDAGDFIAAPAASRAIEAANETAAVESAPWPGRILGYYRVIEEIGRGGMSEVYRAVRDDKEFEQQVAIKVLRRGYYDLDALTRRFRVERQILASLSHPNIAHLLDGGSTQEGLPYLVMEYISGRPIDVWCEHLDLVPRLRLFRTLCDAVQYVHRHLMVHGDLKCSNILVTDDGVVKLLDFGIAKLLNPTPAFGNSDGKLTGVLALTPEYASPEQVRGQPITTASDVYSLGVVLYRLLTGRLPFRPGTTYSYELAAQICEHEPARPSAVSDRWRRRLRGDLDAIVLKALQKDPEQRYASAEQFSQDLGRYLGGFPVAAGGTALGYRAVKFAKRHRVAVAAGALFAISLMAGIVTTSWQAHVAMRERERALSLAGRNEAVIDFFSSMLTEIAPADQPVRVADLLDRSRQILMNEEDIPEHRAAILHMLAAYYLSSGKPAQADEMLARSLELTKATSDTELRATLLCESAYAASLLGRPDDAKRMIEQGLTFSGGDSLTTVQCLRNRAYIAQNTNDPQAALEYAQQAQARLKQSPIAKPDVEAELLADIAAAHYLAGRNDAAERYYAEALAKFVSMGRGESPSIFFLRNNWGIASFGSGDPRRALEQYDEALRIAVQRSIGGEPPPYLLINRAFALVTLARYDDALAAYDVAIESATRAGHAAVRIAAVAGRANTRLLTGDVDGAERELAPLMPEIGQTVPGDSVPAMSVLQVRARVDAERGRLSQSIAGLSKIVAFFDGREMRVAALVRAVNARSDVYLRSGDGTLAMADAQRSIDIARTLQGGKPYSSLTGQGLLLMARAQELRGELATARTVASEAVPHLTQTLGAKHPDTLRAAQIAAAARTVR